VKSRRGKWAGHVARTGTTRNVCRVSVQNALETPRRKWENNIVMTLRSTSCEGGRWWGDLVKDRIPGCSLILAKLNIYILLSQCLLIIQFVRLCFALRAGKLMELVTYMKLPDGTYKTRAISCL
jgi:hypothetical protein